MHVADKIVSAIVLALCLSLIGAVWQTPQPSQAMVARDCLRSVVMLRTMTAVDGTVTETKRGSAVCVSVAGYYVTAAHIVCGDDFARVEMAGDSGWMAVTVVDCDRVHDVALLYVRPGNRRLHAAVMSTDQATPGDTVYVAGFPYSYSLNGPIISRGIVSAAYTERVDGDGSEFIPADAVLNPGDSGGGMFDARGRLIGINSWIYSPTGGPWCGLSYAAPVRWVLPMLRGAGLR